MNNAGLPGTGLGGLFYLLLALFMPVAELYATAQGRSSRERWRLVGTQFTMACAIIAAVAATVVGYLHVSDVPRLAGSGDLPGPLVATLLGVVPLVGVLTALRVWSALAAGRPADDDGGTATAPGRDERAADATVAGDRSPRISNQTEGETC